MVKIDNIPFGVCQYLILQHSLKKKADPDIMHCFDCHMYPKSLAQVSCAIGQGRVI
jgi:hypothetical protein